MSSDDRDFADIFAEFPQSGGYPLQPDAYAEHIHQLKKAVAIPVIGSLNGRTDSPGSSSRTTSNRQARMRSS